jgi:hypothetical protein
MTFEQAVAKKKELESRVNVNGWVRVNMDDFQVDNMLKGPKMFFYNMDVIEAALSAYEAKINSYLSSK